MSNPETRKSLLIRLQASPQSEAWQEFVEIYEPLIYRLARAKGLQHADAQDMTQDVFAAVERAIDRFDPDSKKGSFRGWLFRITRNLTLNFLTRDRSCKGSGDTEMQLLLQQQPDVDEQTVTWFQLERRREIFQWAAKRVQKRFQPDTWKAFTLTGIGETSIEDAAKQLGKTAGAIRIARCRVLAQLQEEISHFDD